MLRSRNSPSPGPQEASPCLSITTFEKSSIARTYQFYHIYAASTTLPRGFMCKRRVAGTSDDHSNYVRCSGIISTAFPCRTNSFRLLRARTSIAFCESRVSVPMCGRSVAFGKSNHRVLTFGSSGKTSRPTPPS